MGEPTSSHLIRSLSSPAFDTSSSSLNQPTGEVNPMRTLAESISFGRFMSDSLDWERWSAFTHKRYVEEAEKYSKPGSVAAKRAYFEAHYKRKAQEKAVTALNRDSYAQANGTSDCETWEGHCTYTSLAKKSKVNIVEQPYFEAHYKRKDEEKAAAALTPESNTRAHYNRQDEKKAVAALTPESNTRAHYKRKDEETAAAALTPQANTRVNGTSNSESQEGNRTDSSIEKRPKVENIAERPYFEVHYNRTDEEKAAAALTPEANTRAHYNRKDEEKAAAALTPESNTRANGTSDSESWERNRVDSSIEKRPKVDNIVEQPYFEAHYKRKSQEKAAALNQEANAQANGTIDSETQEQNRTDTSIVENSKADTIVEQPDNDDVNYQIAVNDDTMQYKCHVGQSDLDISNVEEVAEDMARTCVDTNLTVENCALVDNSTNEVAVPAEERIPDPGTAGHEALLVKGKEDNSSPKVWTKTTTAKFSPSLDKRKGAATLPPPKSGSKGKTSDRNSSETTRLTTRSLHLSVNLPSGTGTSKIAAAAEKSRKGINSGSKGKKSVGDSFEMKGLTGRSIHRSINLPAGTGTRKTTAAAEQSRKDINSASKSKKSVGGSVEMKGLTARSLHRSINLPSGTGTRKTAAATEQSRKDINNVSKSKKSVGGSVETKKLTSQSLHRSINLPSGIGTRKTAAATEKSRKDINNVLKSKKSVGGLIETKRLTSRSLHRSIDLPSGTGKRKTAAATELSRKDINNVSKSKKSVGGGSIETKRLTSRSLHRSINLPSGTGTSKTAAAAEQSRNSMKSVSKSKKSVGGSVETKGLTARSSHMSINLPSGAGGSRKTATAAVKPRNGINHASNIMKTAGDSVVKRPAARSLHMSINLPSGASLASKTASELENNRSKRVHTNLSSVSKHHQVASPTSAKASHGFSSQASEKPPPQGRRTERLLNKSVTGGATANAKLSPSSVACLKSSSPTKSNQGSRTISPPSRFRSGERAVKRKEEKNYGNSRKPPVSTNNTKRVSETNNRTRQSVTSSPNMTRENASPNIQH